MAVCERCAGSRKTGQSALLNQALIVGRLTVKFTPHYRDVQGLLQEVSLTARQATQQPLRH